ncbi:MAG TPA: hypothetical protein VGL71_03040 [Urbifossiella sp.]|jgi:hypothetical protein
MAVENLLLSASELRLLPAEERDAILAEAAALAEEYYLHDADLTDFNAYGEEELHGRSSDTQTR